MADAGGHRVYPEPPPQPLAAVGLLLVAAEGTLAVLGPGTA